MKEPIVYTTIDKQKRDILFEELRKNGTPEEKQAVKFSGNELVGDEVVKDYAGGESGTEKSRTRLVFRSTWSVSHPAETKSH